jgi:hypothetical protein
MNVQLITGFHGSDIAADRKEVQILIHTRVTAFTRLPCTHITHPGYVGITTFAGDSRMYIMGME